MKKVFFVRYKRDKMPYMLVTVRAGGTDFQPLADEADDVADVFESVYRNRPINKQELDSALDDDFTIEGPINPTRGNLNLLQDFLADVNQPLAPRKLAPSAKSFDISSVPLGFSDNNGKVNLTEYKARNFLYEQTKTTFNYEVKRVRSIWDPSLSIPGTGRRGGWRCPVGTRYGGQITDRFGRNCGWGVARRIANAITNIGERMEGLDDNRRGRRVERRNRRMLERLGRAEGEGRAERGLRNVAEALDGGEGTPTPDAAPAPKAPRKPGRGAQARRRARNTTEALAEARDRGLRDSERRRVRREIDKPDEARTDERTKDNDLNEAEKALLGKIKSDASNFDYAGFWDVDVDLNDDERKILKELIKKGYLKEPLVDYVNQGLEQNANGKPIGERQEWFPLTNKARRFFGVTDNRLMDSEEQVDKPKKPQAPRKRPRNARKPAKRPQGEARKDPTKPVGGPNETEDYAGYINRKYDEYAENVRKIRERGGQAGFLTRREWYDINKGNLDDAWRKKGKGEAPDDFMPPTPAKKRRRQPGARKKPPVQDKEPTPEKPEPKKIEEELPNQEPTMARALKMLADKGWEREPAPNRIGNKWKKGNYEITFDKDENGDVFVAKNLETGEMYQIGRGEVPLDEQLEGLEDVLADQDPDFPNNKPKTPKKPKTEKPTKRPAAEVNEENAIANAKFDADARVDALDALFVGGELDTNRKAQLKRKYREMQDIQERANKMVSDKVDDLLAEGKLDDAEKYVAQVEKESIDLIEETKKQQTQLSRIAQNENMADRVRQDALRSIAENGAQLDGARMRLSYARQQKQNIADAKQALKPKADSPKTRANENIFDSDLPINNIVEDIDKAKPSGYRDADGSDLKKALELGEQQFNVVKQDIEQRMQIRGGDALARVQIANNEDEIKNNLGAFRERLNNLADKEYEDDAQKRRDLMSAMQGNLAMAKQLELENELIQEILDIDNAKMDPVAAVQRIRDLGVDVDAVGVDNLRITYDDQLALKKALAQSANEKFQNDLDEEKFDKVIKDADAEIANVTEWLSSLKDEKQKLLDRLRTSNIEEKLKKNLIKRIVVKEGDIDNARIRLRQARNMKQQAIDGENNTGNIDAVVAGAEAKMPDAETNIKFGNPFKPSVVKELDLGIKFGEKGIGKYEPIVNNSIKNEQDAIDFVANGGNLSRVPHEYWRAAIEANSSKKKTDKTKRFRQVAKNGGAIGDTRLFVIRDAKGRGTNQGIVFKASSTNDNVAELVAWNLIHQVGLLKGGAVANGRNEQNNQFMMIPFVFNDIPNGNEITDFGAPAGAPNYQMERIIDQIPEKYRPNLYAARLNQELINFVLGVGDRHPWNGMAKAVKLENGEYMAHVAPIDLGWAGMEVFDNPLRGGGVDREFWDELGMELNAASPTQKTKIQDAVINAYDNAAERIGAIIEGGEDAFVRDAVKNIDSANATRHARFLYDVIKGQHEKIVAKRAELLVQVGRN